MMQKEIRQGSIHPEKPKIYIELMELRVYRMLSRVRYAPLLLVILLFCLAVQPGCTGGSPQQGSQGGLSGPTVTGGSSIQDITSRNAPKISLDAALAALPAAVRDGGVDISGMTLTKVWGYGVDSSGLARTWVLGMQGGGRSELLSFTEGEFKVLDLPATLPQDEVVLANLVSPQDLYRKNLNTIVKEMNRIRVGESDLTLDANSYQVIIHSSTDSATLSFNAKTGELVASP